MRINRESVSNWSFGGDLLYIWGSTVKLDRNGIRFVYEQILGKTMPWLDMVRPPKVQALPDVLTIDEIARLVQCTRERRFRVFWLATDSMGLRLGDTLKLQVADIDSLSGALGIEASRNAGQMG